MDDLTTVKTYVEIVTGIVTSLGIAIGGAWFLVSREGRHTMQITMTLRGMQMNNVPAAVIRVKLKNIGHTSIARGDTRIAAWPIDTSQQNSATEIAITEMQDPNTHLTTGTECFKQLKHLEPNEEVFEDVLCPLEKVTKFYAVCVAFKLALRSKWRWGAIAIYNKTQQPEQEPAPGTRFAAVVSG